MWETVNWFYASLVCWVYRVWREERCTISRCGPVLQRCEARARSHPAQLPAQLEQFLTTTYSVQQKQV